ncbi:fucose mutarotase isoform X2 [Dasypus novemcinctus]|uniref:fucose mutarotase isoform X2 n=1 Tax=Dasypus novemcinctus TaxID=9361 RepID=UPI0039C92500
MVALKGVPALLSPELLYALARMGHGDEIVLADANFPTSSVCRDGPVEIRADERPPEGGAVCVLPAGKKGLRRCRNGGSRPLREPPPQEGGARPRRPRGVKAASPRGDAAATVPAAVLPPTTAAGRGPRTGSPPGHECDGNGAICHPG